MALRHAASALSPEFESNDRSIPKVCRSKEAVCENL
jgi:hypothetical protein